MDWTGWCVRERAKVKVLVRGQSMHLDSTEIGLRANSAPKQHQIAWRANAQCGQSKGASQEVFRAITFVSTAGSTHKSYNFKPIRFTLEVKCPSSIPL